MMNSQTSPTLTSPTFASAVVRSLDVPYERTSEALEALVRVFAARQALLAIKSAMANEDVRAFVRAIGEQAWEAFEELERDVSETEYAAAGVLSRAWFYGQAGEYDTGLARATIGQAAFALYYGEWSMEKAAGLVIQTGSGTLESVYGDQTLYEERLVIDALEFFRTGLKEYCSPCGEEQWLAMQNASATFSLTAKKEWRWNVKHEVHSIVNFLAQQLREEVGGGES